MILHLAHEATSFKFVALSDHVDGYLLIQKGSLNYLTTKTQDFYNIVTQKFPNVTSPPLTGVAFALVQLSLSQEVAISD